MARKTAPRSGRARRTDRPASPGNEPDLSQLGAHETRRVEDTPTEESQREANKELRRRQDYQGP